MSDPYRCPWYRANEDAPVCPFPDDKGACIDCNLFPRVGHRNPEPEVTE